VYGLHLIEEPAPLEPSPRAPAEPPSPLPFAPFHWGLLAGFAVLQVAYLLGLARFALWAVQQLISA
jgi:hypothetical protein